MRRVLVANCGTPRESGYKLEVLTVHFVRFIVYSAGMGRGR